MPRVGLYCRCSTSEQHVEPQLDALRGYAHARGLEIAGEYLDRGISGAKDRRPALDQLLKDARRRRFDVLAVVKLDRLARSVRHLVTLAAEFEALRIDLVVLDQGIDTSCPSGRLLFHVLASIAEFERDLIRERTRAGLAAAKRRGRKLGRKPALRGSATFTIERGLRQGRSIRSLAQELNVDPHTIRRTVQRLGLSPAA